MTFSVEPAGTIPGLPAAWCCRRGSQGGYSWDSVRRYVLPTTNWQDDCVPEFCRWALPPLGWTTRAGPGADQHTPDAKGPDTHQCGYRKSSVGRRAYCLSSASTRPQTRLISARIQWSHSVRQAPRQKGKKERGWRCRVCHAFGVPIMHLQEEPFRGAKLANKLAATQSGAQTGIAPTLRRQAPAQTKQAPAVSNLNHGSGTYPKAPA